MIAINDVNDHVPWFDRKLYQTVVVVDDVIVGQVVTKVRLQSGDFLGLKLKYFR